MDQLLRLEITHSYYKDSRFRGAHLVPSPETAAVLRKWGILHRQVDSSFVLMCDTHTINGVKVPAFMPFDQVKLVFLLSAGDAYFSNVTETPLAESNAVLYFSNHSLNEEEDMLLLHSGNNAGNAPSLVLQPLVFTVPVKQSGAIRTVTVTKDDEVVVQYEVEKDCGSCTVDLTNYGEGAYTISVNEKLLMQCYAIAGWVKAIGIIEIFIDSTVPESYRILTPENGLANPLYRISFMSRATTWTYLVQGKYPVKYQSMVIESIKSPVTFTSPQKITLLNGDTALVFYSNEPLPLTEKPLQYFQLKKNEKSVLVNALPAPGPELVVPADGQIRSEIFVYL